MNPLTLTAVSIYQYIKFPIDAQAKIKLFPLEDKTKIIIKLNRSIGNYQYSDWGFS